VTHRSLHLQNEATDYAELFVDALREAGHEVDVLHPYDGQPIPDDLSGYSSLVCGGGLVDTHEADDNPWLHDEVRLIREALRDRKPFMGLCLGAQLLTVAVGGEVYRCEPHEIGWTEVQLTPEADGDRLFDGLPQQLMAMQWHFYACQMPADDGGAELMRNEVCTQAMRVGDMAWGTQFHIEVTRRLLMTWLDMAPGELERQGYPPERWISAMDEHLDAHMAVGRTLATRFAALASERDAA